MPTQSIETAVWWEDVAKTYFFKGDRSVQGDSDQNSFFCVFFLLNTTIFGGTKTFHSLNCFSFLCLELLRNVAALCRYEWVHLWIGLRS